MPANNVHAQAARILKIIHKIEDSLLAILLLAMLMLASSQIFLRNLFDIGVTWADPLLRIMVLWIGMLGALAASRDNKHITVDVLTRLMPATIRRLTHMFTSLFTASVTGIITYHAVRFVILEYKSESIAVAGIHAWLFESIIPIAFALITIRYLIHFYLHLGKLRTGDGAA